MTDTSAYERAPTTDRSANHIARAYGYPNIERLCDSIPKGARVLDIGAGASGFAKEIARKRSDVRMICVDLSYKDPRIIREVSEDTSPNISFIPGNILELDKQFPSNYFSRVFSYWLLPHLALEDKKIARTAVTKILDVTKWGGTLNLGPTKRGRTLEFDKREDIPMEMLANWVTDQVTLGPIMRRFQLMSNNLTTEFFGTSRYMKREKGIIYVFDPSSKEYINAFSRRGILLASAFSQHVISNALKKE